ncbi:12754_t:CDS:10 [Ambispora gerdemannii]|uniref:12754_t:CDS:1 n=1 Tax=Ambispora gerdemannii TaxID=144530 RepID=A0A9N8VTQ3_9GLOM|nr:12754_t:CDS:10 [Ambispora gerdemannii]
MTSATEIGATRPDTFSNNFWGRDEAGYEVLTMRMRQAKQTCEEVKTMFHDRATIEEDYGKRLLKLAKSQVGKDEIGTLRKSFDATRKAIEATGLSHINLAQQIRTELEQKIITFTALQKDLRKQQTTTLERSLRTKQTHTSHLQKASLMQDSIILSVSEKRIQFLKTHLWEFANLISQSCVADDESSESIRISLEECDIEKDIAIFIRERATGPEIPGNQNFKFNFTGAKDPGPRYTIASFDRDSEFGDNSFILDSIEEASDHSTSVNSSATSIVGVTATPYEQIPSGPTRQNIYSSSPSSFSQKSSLTSRRAINESEEQEPLNPLAKQYVSIGGNMLEINMNNETTNTANGEDDPIKQALANFENQNPSSNIKDPQDTNVSNQTLLNNNSPKYINEDKPQPPIPLIQNRNESPNYGFPQQSSPQQQFQQPYHRQEQRPQTQPQHFPYQQQQQQPSRQQHNQYPYQQQYQRPPPQSSQQQFGTIAGQIYDPSQLINGPGDFRRQPSAEYGPQSSQQQEIESMINSRSRSPQPSRTQSPRQNDQSKQNGSPSFSSTINQQQSLIHQSPSASPQVQSASPHQTVSRSDSVLTSSSSSSGNPLGITIDARGRVTQDTLAEKFMENNGKLPPATGIFTVNPNIRDQQESEPVSYSAATKPFQPQLQQQINNQHLHHVQPANIDLTRPYQKTSPQNHHIQPANIDPARAYQKTSPQIRPTTHTNSVMYGEAQRPPGPIHHVGYVVPSAQQRPAPKNTIQRSNTVSSVSSGYIRGAGVDTAGFHQQLSATMPSNTYNNGNPARRQSFANNNSNSVPFNGRPPQNLQQPVTVIQPVGEAPSVRPVVMRTANEYTDEGRPILFYVTTLYDYRATIPEEISFTAGDILAVLAMQDDGWWEGEILDVSRKVRGLFPSNFTTPLD